MKLSKSRFSSKFTGEEFFLKDHIVQGLKVMPAVAFLEMARETVKLALGDAKVNIQLKNIVWATPFFVEAEPKTIHIGLIPEEKGHVAYEIYSEVDSKIIIHSQGMAVIEASTDDKMAPHIDIAFLKSNCNQQEITSDECYKAFSRLGIHYGPTHQGIKKIYVSKDSALAKLNLSLSQKEFELQPGIMDSALQSSIGILNVSSDKPNLPFAMDSLKVFSPCTSSMWARIQQSPKQVSDGVQKLDIDLCDDAGKVCVEMKGFSTRSTIILEKAVQDDFEKVSHYIKTQLSTVLNLPIHKIDSREHFEKYGIDSVMVTELTNELEKTFGSLSKTLFFEYQTIDELSQYFINTHFSKLTELMKLDDTHSNEISKKRPQRKSTTHLNSLGKEIAIIGISGRYPQSLDLTAYWNNLRDGKDCITEIPSNRWDWRKYYDPYSKESGAHYSKWGGFIEGVEQFDPLFFNISPSEAVYIDPQERLFLEHVWMALEDAGLTKEDLQRASFDDLPGQVGVYAGVMWSEYQLFGAEESLRGTRVALGNSFASIANRVSFVLNLHGPSITVDTMCSSSLTSIHLACEDLKSERTDIGIAGGVNVSIHPNKYLALSYGQFIAKDGHCQSFGEGGDGYIPGEGVGVVILKRLKDAIAARDPIYGVIKGSAINHGGKTNGYTVPNPNAQHMVVTRALKEAKINPRTVSYIEAHGTGTKLGDPIEITGLTKAFASGIPDTGYCALGSAKSNIGHCESAAGIAGITKVLLQMKHKKIVPSLHSEKLNPNIDFGKTPFVVNQKLKEWVCPIINGKEYPRIAGISSFGAGGSNAHVIIEEYIAEESVTSEANAISPALIVLSAKNSNRLTDYARKILAFIQDNSSISLEAMAYTLQVGREAMEERLGIIATSIKDLIEKLHKYISGMEDSEGIHRGNIKKRNENEMPSKIIEELIVRKDYSQLLEFWTKGLTIDWNQFYGEHKPKKINLPTYPFAKEKYWIDTTLRSEIGCLRLSLEWKEKEIDKQSKIGKEVQIHVIRFDEKDSPFETKALELFQLVQNVIQSKPKKEHLFQVVTKKPLELALSGILKTAHIENSKIHGQVLLISNSLKSPVEEVLLENQQSLQDQEIWYDGTRRYVKELTEQHKPNSETSRPYKENGVYLITGGAGGLGLIFAKDILGHIKSSTVILTGRSNLNIEDNLRPLQTLAETTQSKVIYYQADITKQEDVQVLIEKIQREYGTLNGLIHAAGVIKDNFIFKKSPEEFLSVLCPKVTGTINLDEATKNINLDFFVLFSSVAGAFGNLGQADYAAGNAFMDAFAKQRNAQNRYGQTLSINWPLWKEGGMSIDESSKRMIKMKSGVVPMETSTGLQEFAQALALKQDQVILLEGEISTMINVFLQKNKGVPKQSIEPVIDPNVLQQKTLNHLKKVFGEVIKLSTSQVDEDESFENYGINSILIAQLNEKLVNVFGEMPRTLIFEHTNLKSLANYFVSAYPAACALWVGLKSENNKQITPEKKQISIYENVINKDQDPIAIIGINGRYAQSKNLNEFWENLQTGKNCIGEITPDRWPLEDFFNPDPQAAIAQRKSYCKWGGFLEGYNEFDPLFFNISPREALNIDPQERLFLQSCWECLEDAGYTREELGKIYNHQIGVFAGITKTGFELYGPELWNNEEGVFPHTSFSSTANRVSYVLDLHGPSMPIDTMCSASLTAIHEACEHLRRSECKMAIAGGVNLYLHPTSYIGLCHQNMLSIDGKCKSFGISGNGFVPGEGVGTVLLKPFSLAIQDGDHIYGIVRGSSVNHGGKTNGYTVPNPTIQGDLIRTALSKANINARFVTYIEAHGTGTELGDPIEFRGLTKAFEPDTTEIGYCALGSVKSNIGHCESAAGIAGVTKVLLQMQHRKIAPSLHSETLNPNINFKNTPFIVNQKLKEWDRPIINGKEYPRIAGISSFGAGGSNAHIIIEEYVSEKDLFPEINEANPALIVLSAKNTDRLKVYAHNLAAFIQDSKNFSLQEFAYTLQVGREPMEERLGIIANSTEDLIEKFNKYISNEEVVEDLFVGHTKQLKEAISFFGNELSSKAAEEWISKKNYSKLLELWTKGLNIDWTQLYKGQKKPKKMSLPTYPFAKEKYWIGERGNTEKGTQRLLHPLVQQNSSTLSQQKFTSIFTGEEFFLRDHIVNGQKLFPGVAYLEMALVAVKMALEDPTAIIEIKNVVWIRPIIVETEPKTVHIRLIPEENETIFYEIYTENNKEITVHSEGKAVIKASKNHSLPLLDIATLKSTGDFKEYTSEECYKAFDQLGIQFGPGHRGIERIYAGKNSALAQLQLPVALLESLKKFELHPSMIDSALQASIGMMFNNEPASKKPLLPFALSSLEVFSSCTARMWSLIKKSQEQIIPEIQKLDLELYDDEGKICLVMKGFSSRLLEKELGSENQMFFQNEPSIEPITVLEVDNSGSLKEKANAYVKKIVGKALKIPPIKIDSSQPLEAYGMDSILIGTLTNLLRQDFGEISNVLLFEVRNIDGLVDYLIKKHQEILIRVLKMQVKSVHKLSTSNSSQHKRFQRFIPSQRPSTYRTHSSQTQDVAIIGMSGRYPNAKDIGEFWTVLREGKNCITEIPAGRWDWKPYFDEEKGKLGKIYTKWGGFIDDVDKFDPLFFQISPVEAERMDPQERLFLQEVYKSIEDSGYTPAKLSEKQCVGVFVGVMNALYASQPSYWSIANRISYAMNFHGPSMSVDTACSSSLTAIHLAIESLQNGTSDCAIAGGVNLILKPIQYINLSAMTMLSATKECKSFGDKADGFVDGEGVGSIVLKPLQQAILDNDRIYGVIKGSMVNAGGKTNGYTVPNPTAQYQVVLDALNRSNVNARTVSYIEAHGTGTILGDPIEVAGLTQAFEHYSQDKKFCAIGSVKSNIGHLESAAGIAGVTKVLLQLQHRKLVPSLHSQSLNPNIDFEKTPFLVNQELRQWNRPVIDGKEYPRIAGISSFGAGGSNAHIIIEEYIPNKCSEKSPEVSEANPVLIVLSAKNNDRLKEYAKMILTFIQKNHNDNADQETSPLHIGELAYTLQVGREAMEERLGIIASSQADLEEKLTQYLTGEDSENLYSGQVKKNKEFISDFEADAELQNTIEIWLEKKKYEKLLKFWTKGLSIDWTKLYGVQKPKKISLPTYPFAKERYWMEETSITSFKIKQESLLHPLVQKNTSTLSEQKFSSTFTGEEFFLKDHIVNGQKVLPGVAYLEMAREAVKQALGDVTIKVQLKNIVWATPIIVADKPKTIHIKLFPEVSGSISYEIYAKKDVADNHSDIILHGQGIALIIDPEIYPTLNIEASISIHNYKKITSTECYKVFDQWGIQYGHTLRGIEKIYAGHGSILAKLNMPVLESLGEFELHPSLMDSALQASIGMLLTAETAFEKTMLPFSLSSLEVLAPCSPHMWVKINKSQDKIDSSIEKLDIEIYDQEGKACVIMKGFSSRILERKNQQPAITNQLVHLVPTWEVIRTNLISTSKDFSANVTIIGETKIQQEILQSEFSNSRCVSINPNNSIQEIAQLINVEPIDQLIWINPEPSFHPINDNVIAAQEHGVLLLFKLLKALLLVGYGTKPLVLTIITFNTQSVSKNERIDPSHAGLHGLIGSLAKEYPNWKAKLLDLDVNSEFPLKTMLNLPSSPEGNAYIYRNKEWFKQILIPINSDSLSRESQNKTTYRQNGVYVVIGGNGGIGEVWTRWMIEHYQAHVIWLGRREHNAEIQAKIDSFSKNRRPEYIQADATNANSLKIAYDKIKSKYSQINGIIHSAIVLSDSSIAKMPESQFKDSLSPKVDISVRIAQVFGSEKLDFVLFFSSIQSFIKAPGQSNYAAGCVFKDAFAKALKQTFSCKVKVMNWGYWGSVGVVANSFYKDRMDKAGIGSIEPEEGMQALQMFMDSPFDQIGFIKTSKLDVKSEDVSSQEQITIYPQVVPSVIEQLDIAQHDAFTHSDKDKEEIATMERLSLQILGAILKSLDLINPKANNSLLNALPGFYHLWLNECLRLIPKQPACDIDNSESLDLLWKEWDEKKHEWMQDANKKAQLILLETCLKALPNILTKKCRATDIMFPNSSMELVEGIYKNNKISDKFNEILVTTVVAYIQKRIHIDPNVKIRFLEIGAGTGGTTAGLLPKLSPFQNHIDQYLYTDLSKAFLLHAQAKFVKNYPYVVPQLFDVTKSLLEQGINSDSYDVVIATNVLHATPNIRKTLQNAKAALHRSGIIVLNEISDHSLFTHLTFGLLEGWWLSQDEALRIPGSPGLYPESWERVLKEQGFSPVIFPAKSLHHFGQQIIVTQSDGLVKQPNEVGESTSKSSIIREPKIEQITSVKKQNVSLPNNEILSPKLGDYVKTQIRDSLAESLKIDAKNLDNDEIFSDYGVDSILGVQLVNLINKKMDIELQTIALFEYSTVDSLTNHILKSYGSSLKIGGTDSIALSTESKSLTPSVQTQHKNRFMSSEKPLQKSMRDIPTQLATSTEVNNPSKTITQEEIAIIGLSGRFAKSDTVDAFWKHLEEGNDLVNEVSRWDLSSHYKEDITFCRHGSFLDNIDQFDPTFFKISDLEATYMDPQQRLFLEESWKALEDAGYVGDLINDMNCGVYVGCANGDYSQLMSEQAPPHSFWGNATSVIPARISYYLNLQGPAVAIDTACSSSLVAVHLACQGLWTHETEMALAGGVFLQSTPTFYLVSNKAKMLSATGKCHTFDESADGFVPGEGIGVVVLKRLKDALRDGDHIYGVIRGSGINQDGTTNGITAPSPKAQERLECEVYNRFHIHPEEIQLIEAHGTGTNLGDMIEFNALTKSFRKHTDKKQYCAIGSVKTNIGHLGTAAGISGVIKILLSLKHKKLPPALHYQKGNRNINFQDSPFYVNTHLKNWETTNGAPRCAAINAFGFSGTNAHIVIQEAPPIQRVHQMNHGYLIVLSAQTQEQLTTQIEQLLQVCREQKEIDLGNVSYTLLTGRKRFNHRWGCVVRNIEELGIFLSKWLGNNPVTQVFTSVYNGNHFNEQISMKKYGDHCIEMCQNLQDATEYLENLSVICDLVVQGYKFDIRKLYGEGYSKLSLPTYPFAMQTYWVDPISSTNIHSKKLSLPTTSSKHGNSAKMTLFLKQLFADQIQKSVSQIDSTQDYFEMGITSIDLVKITHVINKLIDPEFSATLFFDYPTISAIADYLVGQYPDAIDKILNKQNQEVNKNKRNSKTPASFQQQRLWFIDKYQGHSLNYHNAILITLHGSLDELGLEKSFQEIIKRHDSLRTNFIEENGEVLQIVKDVTNFFLQREDLSNETDPKASMQGDLKSELNEPFNLAKDLLIRVKLYKLKETENGLLINIHHIVSDGWSLDVLAKEVALLYRAWVAKKDFEGQLLPLQIQYTDFAEKQQKQLKGTVLEKKLSYWKDRLFGIETLELPTTFKRPSIQSHKGNRINFTIDNALLARLEHLCKTNGATLFMGLLATWSVLLKRYSNQDVISIGTPVANRNYAETEQLIGFFVNTIVLKQNLQGNPTFIELLARVKTNTINDFKHQDAPLEKIIDALNLKRDESRSPLFQVMMVLQNDWASNIDLPEMSMEMQLLTNETTKYDLTLHLNRNSELIFGALEYSVDLFSRNFIENMIQHFLTLIDRFVTDPLSNIDQVSYLKPEELKELIVKFNNTKSKYPMDKCIHDLFTEHAKKNPKRPAVIFENHTLTYEELDQKSTKLAIYLQSLGVKPDDLIGICSERSVEMIIAILGILKSGGAYVPLDPDYPEDRLKHILNDSRIKILFTQTNLKNKIHHLLEDAVKTIFLEGDLENLTITKDNRTLRKDVRPNNLVYVIYTSGSTGKPKGVMIEHSQLINYVMAIDERISIQDYHHFALAATFATDLGNTILFGALCFGKSLHIVPEECLYSSEMMVQFLKRNSIDCLKLVPSHIKVLLDESHSFPKLRLIMGGETLSWDLVEKILSNSPDTIITNHYGPTETTIGASTYTVDHSRRGINVPIGRPLSNVEYYILDAYKQPTPVGVLGELYIAGSGLARGYLHRTELTEEKFITHSIGDDTKKRMYRTGDLARYLPEGYVEFLGRSDHQVKIRGFRIELGEIESILNQYPEIKSSVVVAQGTQENKQLIGFYLPSSTDGAEIDIEKLKSYLKEKLPDHMIPLIFVMLTQIPLTPNGKLDRKLLEQKNVSLASTQQYVAPRNELEEIIVTAFSELLNIKKEQSLGIRDNFFELGGNSLLSVRMVNVINKLANVNLTVANFFRFPTPEGLAQFIQNQRRQTEIQIPIKDISRIFVSKKTPTEHLQNILKLESAHRYKFAFPELFHLNNVDQGRPIFWIHPGLGGVYPYIGIATEIPRPFYSIQARGYQTKYVPLRGIHAMASYYVQIIQSVQPHGPYDLGGYSLGGTLAYEITRQLQALGEQVSTLVMVDSMDTIALKKVNTSFKSTLLQNANTSLIPLMMQHPGEIILINRNECDSSLDEEAYIVQLITLLKKRGLQKDPSDLKKMALISESYDITHFSILPLLHPDQVQCYYFRNTGERFFGELSSYFCISEEENKTDNAEYWREWESHLPIFTKIDVVSSNHMVMLNEPQSAKRIIECCKDLYFAGVSAL